MDKKLKEFLEILYQKANKDDHWVVLADIGISGEERRKICASMEQNGLITNVSLCGTSKIQCDLTQKAIEYCQKNNFNNKQY